MYRVLLAKKLTKKKPRKQHVSRVLTRSQKNLNTHCKVRAHGEQPSTCGPANGLSFCEYAFRTHDAEVNTPLDASTDPCASSAYGFFSPRPNLRQTKLGLSNQEPRRKPNRVPSHSSPIAKNPVA